VPTDTDWTILTNYLGGEVVAGGKMKSTGTQYWASPNQDATNASGFEGLPAGYRLSIGTFNMIGLTGFWWSSTEATTTNAWHLALSYILVIATRDNEIKKNAFSIRCLKGAVAGIETIELPKKTLLKITDILGRDTEFTPNVVQIYHYSDGTVEKVFSAK
jgi:hypothetical protein